MAYVFHSGSTYTTCAISKSHMLSYVSMHANAKHPFALLYFDL